MTDEHAETTPGTPNTRDADHPTTPAIEAVRASGIAHEVTRHGRVSSLEEAAAARGVEPRDLVKSMVVRIDDEHYVFALVPGDRQISWPKLRALLGVSRLSMPDADRAREVTGYERGTITPFGSTTAWPVYVDESVAGRRISIGGGAPGVGITAQADDVVSAVGATLADISE
ncbi:aminoacyl-tRNA deacylase [Georgenia sp. Z1344]|uniref:aminoacyl-tRNA deacylase n=1 Tax=Georgenia sp. Z1344 TaxID=3416706 RepID=UPI003CF0DF9E